MRKGRSTAVTCLPVGTACPLALPECSFLCPLCGLQFLHVSRERSEEIQKGGSLRQRAVLPSEAVVAITTCPARWPPGWQTACSSSSSPAQTALQRQLEGGDGVSRLVLTWGWQLPMGWRGHGMSTGGLDEAGMRHILRTPRPPAHR